MQMECLGDQLVLPSCAKRQELQGALAEFDQAEHVVARELGSKSCTRLCSLY